MVAWIDGYGFREVIYQHHRADEADRQHPAPGPDEPYLAKFDFDAVPLTHPMTAEMFVLDMPPLDPVGTLLATPDGIGPSREALTLIGGWLPCCPVGGGPSTQPSDDTIIPPVAPVPLAATLPLLIAALVSLAIVRRKRR
ncbi:hypothetical protein [Paracoccus hibiscisoli]|uniref:Uncharacterized protein n=1 Tax=Paracoccus hibiscisoli TaxID=2023261 RepID=A0A4U0QVH8_9RHOB|nr:hypothetical protein [Paracoccus hibiscisoli]TJZ86135.1 hypothetical protein FA740_04405 [Paracoccus hibiscisoli]